MKIMYKHKENSTTAHDVVRELMNEEDKALIRQTIFKNNIVDHLKDFFNILYCLPVFLLQIY
jgi:hypothetical protein